MTDDIEVLRMWIRVVLIIAAVCTTSVPVLFAFTPWRSRLIGKLFMTQAISFAVAMDLSALFSIWQPKNILVVFWVDAVVLSAIAISTFLFTAWLWNPTKYYKKGKKDNEVHRQDL
jgi:hypothetical protein